MCQALLIQYLEKTNKVPKSQGAYILMWERKQLSKSRNVFQAVGNVLKKIKQGSGLKGDWGM